MYDIKLLEKYKLLKILKEFVEIYQNRPIKFNKNGMKSADMFSLWYTIKVIKPSTVVESGVLRGASTWMIRQANQNLNIISIDPNNQQIYKDKSAKYYIKKKFKDFSKHSFRFKNINNFFCFFDDHINAFERLIHCHKRGIKHLFFNDNYPINCGSHLTLEHCLNYDKRFLSIDEYKSKK